MNTDHENDTIAALCTAPGGALAIVRISGPDALRVGTQVWHGSRMLGHENARRMILGKVGSPGEPCLAVFMPGPHSYTGENTVELHCHGGSFAPKRLLELVLSAGARSAEPGEFTRRAFLNGKMDLTQAEAVADLIAAKSERAAHLAEKQLSGSIGNTIRNLREPLIHLRSEMESRLDFSEEDLDWESPELYLSEIHKVQNEVKHLLKTTEAGSILRDGVCVVIAGRPNAGKSSLLNALLGYDRAIVTAIPGTTRDTLEEFVSLRNIPVRLTDTAGLHEDAIDPVERIGIDRSRVSLKNARIIFWVLDASDAANAAASAEYLKQQYSGKQQIIALWNKIDSPDTPDVLPVLPEGIHQLRISARTGRGLDELLDIFSNLIWDCSASTEVVSECEISARHAALLRETDQFLSAADNEVCRESWELAAFNLREALTRLGNITGEEIAPDILDEIFSRFCIGK